MCNQEVHCQWGPFGSWSECDSCTKLQTRTRSMVVYAQFGGNRCYGERSETRPCETTQGCPIEDGCGNRFRCRSGKCVSQSLVCNGDQDCEEDGLDEHNCDISEHIVCSNSVPPPSIEILGLGFDAVSGKSRASVINTKSFGGQCRTIFSGVHNSAYRLPLSTLQYSFLVKAQNDFSDEMYTSKWHYAKDIVKRQTVTGTTTGYHNYDFHEQHDKTQTKKLLVLKNDIEVAQFQTNAPRYIPISEAFWKALVELPSVYDYSAYRKILERFGTHYLSAGSLGGSFKVIATIDEETENNMVGHSTQCFKVLNNKPLYVSVACNSCNIHTQKILDVEGGGVSHIAALNMMNLDNPERNWEMYLNWAESVRSFPQVIKQKLRPLSELVKEVQCAGLKKLYLRRAVDQYLAESDPCHCRPCRNNGMVVMDGDECKCICKPNTSGPACEQGTEAEGQQGVIHGSWSCWSAWSSCSGGRRSRSRSCSNPYPQNGGQHCIGEPAETSDSELHTQIKTKKLNLMVLSLSHVSQDPKDIYLVGSKVEYTCTEGFYLVGHSTIECTADQTWSARPGLCTVTSCQIGLLADAVIASPLKETYGIGELVTFSCPAGKQLTGEATAICNPSLDFSPNPADVRYSTLQPRIAPGVQCKLWEKPSRGKCVCKMPIECGSSLKLCATAGVGRKSVLLDVCKMYALQCMGKEYMTAEDSTCIWPERSTTGCTGCHMWENCDDQTNDCRCKDSADCANPGYNVCVRVGEDETVATQTMSECEAGLRRCKGEKVFVVSIQPCTS
uniref:Complement component C7 n=1 Tax=Oreochromis niloticus TaxID=8128 RepID=A0A669CNY5_ORENI